MDANQLYLSLFLFQKKMKTKNGDRPNNNITGVSAESTPQSKTKTDKQLKACSSRNENRCRAAKPVNPRGLGMHRDSHTDRSLIIRRSGLIATEESTA